MCTALNVSWFRIFNSNFQYARVLNFQGFTGFTYFPKYGRVLVMRREAIMERF